MANNVYMLKLSDDEPRIFGSKKRAFDAARQYIEIDCNAESIKQDDTSLHVGIWYFSSPDSSLSADVYRTVIE